MSSLNRLIKLAKRTGDRLIVHNPTDETDVVIMDVSEYEMLLDENRDVRELSERQLLNQINRDIVIWRANDKLESERNESFDFAQDREEIFDFEKQESDWHGVGSVLENRELEDFEPPFFAESLADKEEENDVEELNLEINHEPQGYMASLQKIAEKKEIKEVILTDLPQAESQSASLIADDEPVFYEEPV